MISQSSELLTEIRKCQSLYHYCEDNHIIYRFILQVIYRMNKVDVLLEFLADDLRENCSLEDLKLELLKLYKLLTQDFVQEIHRYSKSMEPAF